MLIERMSFKDLYRVSDPARIDRSKDVRAKSLEVTSMDGNEAWTFTYKSNPSTTGNRWHGYVRFLKEDVSAKDHAYELDCMVDCDCPDYRYRFAYNNAKEDAGALGAGAWNSNNGRPPRPREQGGVGDLGPGMCKHLIALGEFLKTNIEPNAPEPEEEPEPTPAAATLQPPKSSVDAPDPDDNTYSDSRDSGYSDSRSGDLRESKNDMVNNLNRLVQSSPRFNVPYEDEQT